MRTEKCASEAGRNNVFFSELLIIKNNILRQYVIAFIPKIKQV
ncbi:Uncharacterized protein dnm_095370 [Desulfonema magnum]|uniref:Uncharacterized protein n=1 Tax=Desulfonema magnum TaxID=45655 RepID=A0A975BXB4_9BACT|nr:Uncharacterized protein dnm_095370 [Desulfonema magnum]